MFILSTIVRREALVLNSGWPAFWSNETPHVTFSSAAIETSGRKAQGGASIQRTQIPARHSSTIGPSNCPPSFTSSLLISPIDTMVDVSSSAYVEVIATVADDGRIRTRSVPMAESSISDSCLVDGCYVEESCSEAHKESKSAHPALVPVGSNSDSEDSSSYEESGSKGAANPSSALLMQCSTTTTDVALANAAVANSDEAVGMYDCLSDQITNLFCPVEQPTNYCVYKSTKSGSSSEANHVQVAAPSCTDVACTDYQFKDLFSSGEEGADVFASLQFWLTPSQEEKLTTTHHKKPQNRSTTKSRKRRSNHIRKLWNTWHAEKTIPIERSKSMPAEREGLIPSLMATDSFPSDICYDSDPEQELQEKVDRGEELQRLTTTSFRDYQPQPIQTSIGTIWEDECCYFDDDSTMAHRVPPTPRNSMSHAPFHFYPRRQDSFSTPTSQGMRSSLHDSPLGPTEFDLMHPEGEYVLKDFIQEATNTRLNMVWHRRTKAADYTTKRSPPVAVTGAFEVGAHLDNVVVQPKFTWSPAYEPHLDNRKIRLSGAEPHSIELLSIIRVVKPTKLNRRLYPFARLDRTFCITTNDEQFPYLVLEAASTRERDWMVKALKIIVARLASIIIVRDEAMLMEFFTPYAALMNLDHPESPDHVGHMDDCDDAGDYEQREEGPPLDVNGGLQLISYEVK